MVEMQSHRGFERRLVATWLLLVTIAVIGSGIFGATLALALPDQQALDTALWLAGSAGLRAYLSRHTSSK